MRYLRLLRRIEADGQWLFRWRSYIPLAMLPVTVLALAEEARLEVTLGDPLDDAWMVGSLAVALFGLAIRWITVGYAPPGTSGRNTRAQRAEVLNTTGTYSLVRNPLYLGNFIAILGVVLATKVWWYVAIAALAYWLYIERVIAAEEAYLARKFGPAYDAWVARTPAFLPRLTGWRPPTTRFSLRTVLRREYNGVMAVGSAFFLCDLFEDLVFEGEDFEAWLLDEPLRVGMFVASTVTFVVLRLLKKRTDLLRVPGR